MAAPQDKFDLKPNAPEESLGASLPAYHTDFSSVDSDIVLASSDGTLYRVHSYTLRTTSGLFRTILSLPPPLGGHSPSPVEIHEPDAVVEPLLRLMCGIATPPWPSLDALSAVLSLAEKWSAPGPLAFLHTALSADTFLSADPLRIYALATHFGWRATAQRAAAATLTLDLSAPAHAPRLAQLAAPALLALLRLHRTRRDALRALLDSPERFLAGNGAPYHCSACAVTPLDNTSWRALKHRIFREADARPRADALGVCVGGMQAWPETRACWAARCTKPGCGSVNYDRLGTVKQLRACVMSLPSKVDLDWMDQIISID